MSLADTVLKTAKLRGDRTLVVNVTGMEMTLEYESPEYIQIIEMMTGLTFEPEDSSCGSTGSGCAE